VLKEVKADMDNFVSLCKGQRDFVNLLRSPIIPHLKKAEILNKIFKGKVNDLSLAIFDLITRKNRENILPEMTEEFIRLYNEKMGFQEATVTTTFSLDAQTRGMFEKLVTDLSGKKPLLDEKVDSSILGGFVLTLEDRQIDDSVSGAIRDLKIKFKTSNQ
jgi:F-type H+-transporting ATPase subunit delta